MKKKNILTALTLSLTIGLGATAYAYTASTSTPTNPNTDTDTNTNISTGIGLRRATGFRGYDFATSVIKEKLNVTDEDISNARTEGKTISEFAEEKGLSHEDLQAALIEAKTKAIDDAVAKGTILKEDGETYKKAIKENASNAVPGQGRLGAPKGNGQGKRGQGLKNGNGTFRNNGNRINCPLTDSSSK
ncbi:hypothetical protein [Clostridium ganghwense]|uniref:DUF2680 domain-containing protein n=1 Tax=Clostridium ganghwense TaxID=312089 RepID=A0ABT4CJ67_9CLOT|nr:hypothetical protein [Clostridium ganghwense]MCY6369090.1 hypothetical protein [Clostridium ganghwense]